MVRIAVSAILVLLVASHGIGLPTFAQKVAIPARPKADPADVNSLDAILKAVYDVISGAAGTRRDWDRFRTLFLPEARLIPASTQKDAGETTYRVMSPDDYISRSRPYLEQEGFFEQEVHRVVDQFGPIAHVFSTYEGRRNLDDPAPFVRGINSLQLFHDGNRWWVLSIFWTSERDHLPIPTKYLR
jgi:hypothetical protein